jgi:hypothetical protein
MGGDAEPMAWSESLAGRKIGTSKRALDDEGAVVARHHASWKLLPADLVSDPFHRVVKGVVEPIGHSSVSGLVPGCHT